MTVAEVSATLDITTQYTAYLLRNGVLKGELVGRVWEIDSTSVKEYLDFKKEKAKWKAKK